MALSLLVSSATAFGQAVTTAQDTRFLPYGLSLRFSRDGRFLHVVGLGPDNSTQGQHVRVVTYSAKTGAVVHVINLQPDTQVLSTTSDGGTAIILTDSSGEHGRPFLLDTGTGQLEAIPESWYEPESNRDAAISGDGRLVSIYSETDSATPMIVSVYDWRTKTLVATRRSEYVAAGGIMGGGVTEDGAIEFEGNRVGSTIVDLKTGRSMGQFGPSTVRSPDGAWAVQFPNQNWGDPSTDALVKNGADGRTVGKLNVQVPEEELNGGISGAFCGTSRRFIMASKHAVAAYLLHSGKLLASFPEQTWKDASTGDDVPAVACSPAGTRVAILSGARVTFHDLK